MEQPYLEVLHYDPDEAYMVFLNGDELADITMSGDGSTAYDVILTLMRRMAQEAGWKFSENWPYSS